MENSLFYSEKNNKFHSQNCASWQDYFLKNAYKNALFVVPIASGFFAKIWGWDCVSIPGHEVYPAKLQTGRLLRGKRRAVRYRHSHNYPQLDLTNAVCVILALVSMNTSSSFFMVGRRLNSLISWVSSLAGKLLKLVAKKETGSKGRRLRKH